MGYRFDQESQTFTFMRDAVSSDEQEFRITREFMEQLLERHCKGLPRLTIEGQPETVTAISNPEKFAKA